MTGEIGILNVGAGDTKLVFDPKKPADLKRAAKTVTDMIARGYVILIEAGKDAKTGDTLYRRVEKFEDDTCEYIIAGEIKEDDPHEQPRKRASRRKAAPKIRVPASEARGVAVARTAGG